jgi:predicted RNA-binding Zn ribbon-like protein
MGHFQFIAGDVALDFVNTLADRGSVPREQLVTGADVDRWAREAGLLPPRASLHLRTRQVARVRAVRECVHRLLHSVATGRTPADSLLAGFDATRARAARKRHLVRRNHRLTWQWATRRGDPDRILGPILEQAAELLVTVPAERLRQCNDPACGWLFLDRSRAGRRRWCRMADCGNRAKARRHYQREHPAR